MFLIPSDFLAAMAGPVSSCCILYIVVVIVVLWTHESGIKIYIYIYLGIWMWCNLSHQGMASPHIACVVSDKSF